MTTTAMIGSTTTTQAGDLANQATAVRPPKVTGQDVDLLNPESMMAFFQLQMSDVRQKLGVAMKEQQDRNNIIKGLASLQADLAAYKTKGVGPGDPEWPAFQAKVAQVREALGGGNAGSALDNLLAKTAPRTETKSFAKLDLEGQAHFMADHPDFKVTGDDPLTMTGTWKGDRLSTDDVESIIQQVKGHSDSLSADNQMNMIRVQQFVETSSQLTNLCSNIMKKISDSAMAPINNMR